MKKNKNDLQSATEVLQALLEKGNSPLAEDFQRYRMKVDWPKVVGALIAEKSSPIGYSNGVLYIWVVNATWMNQLFYIRSEILKRVNEYAGKGWAKTLRFTQDCKDVPANGQWTEDPQDAPEPTSPNEDGGPQRDQ